jgi:hypothetical protein
MDTTEPAKHGLYTLMYFIPPNPLCVRVHILLGVLFAASFKMPSKLQTVIGWISGIPNEENQRLLSRFVDFMGGTDTSEKYQRVNLIVVVLFAKYLASDVGRAEVNRKTKYERSRVCNCASGGIFHCCTHALDNR